MFHTIIPLKNSKSINRYIVVYGLLFVILILSTIACQSANSSAKPRQLAVIASGQSRLTKLDGLRKGLTERGYVEGVDYTITLYNAENNRDQIVPLIEQAVADHPDLLITLGGIETDTAKRIVDGSIPIVFIGVADTVYWGIVDSFQHPGNNMTGVDNGYVELTGKRLEYITMFLPQAHNILLLYSENIIPSKAAKDQAAKVAPQLGLNLITRAVNRVDDLQTLCAQLDPKTIDAIIIVPSFVLENAAASILLPQATATGIPVIGLNNDAVIDGAYLAYGASFFEMGYQAARLVDKVFQNTAVGNIPVEFPDLPQISVNLDVARQLEIDLPPDTLPLIDQPISESAQ